MTDKLKKTIEAAKVIAEISGSSIGEEIGNKIASGINATVHIKFAKNDPELTIQDILGVPLVDKLIKELKWNELNDLIKICYEEYDKACKLSIQESVRKIIESTDNLRLFRIVENDTEYIFRLKFVTPNRYTTMAAFNNNEEYDRSNIKNFQGDIILDNDGVGWITVNKFEFNAITKQYDLNTIIEPCTEEKINELVPLSGWKIFDGFDIDDILGLCI